MDLFPHKTAAKAKHIGKDAELKQRSLSPRRTRRNTAQDKEWNASSLYRRRRSKVGGTGRSGSFGGRPGADPLSKKPVNGHHGQEQLKGQKAFRDVRRGREQVDIHFNDADSSLPEADSLAGTGLIDTSRLFPVQIVETRDCPEGMKIREPVGLRASTGSFQA
jgi:hypothetical protein